MTAALANPPDARFLGPEVPMITDDSLCYFLLNVGDGDAQLILLPVNSMGERQAILIDAASARKVQSMLDECFAHGWLADPSARVTRLFALVVGTHPHGDHIQGMPVLLKRYRGQVEEYFLPTASFLNTMGELDYSAPGLRRAILGIPTAGAVRHYEATSITVLGPATGLRNRFDTHGIDVNDTSITLMIEYPATRVVLDPTRPTQLRRLSTGDRGRRLLLAADAQHASWSQTTVDFPAVYPSRSHIGGQLARRSYDRLRAEVLKVPHHASKHGINLELVERVRPSMSLVSSVAGGGSYNFPHAVALDTLREALEPIATKPGAAHSDDWNLGIHYTAGRRSGGAPLGSMLVVVQPKGPLQLWRFGDLPRQPVDFAQARMFV